MSVPGTAHQPCFGYVLFPSSIQAPRAFVTLISDLPAIEFFLLEAMAAGECCARDKNCRTLGDNPKI